MIPLEILGYVASVLVGLVLGLLGGGGSILCIPILVYLFNIEPQIASAYSLFIIGITSLIGAIPKYRDHLVNVKTGFIFGIPSVLSIFSTRKWVVPAIPEIIVDADDFIITKRFLILFIFAALMVFASFSIIRGKELESDPNHQPKTVLLIIEGLLIGFLTGLVGAGGGFLIIPALVFLTRLPFKTAVGTSLFIIAINSLMGFLGDVLNHPMNWQFLFTLTSLAVTGILIGHFFHKKISARKLRHAFGYLVLLMGTFILIKEFLNIHA